jgi:two-component system, LytTR family, response regulator
MKLKVAIIDDEKHAIETLTYDLHENHSEEVEIVFTATNPVEGFKKLHTEKPDLLFPGCRYAGFIGPRFGGTDARPANPGGVYNSPPGVCR